MDANFARMLEGAAGRGGGGGGGAEATVPDK